MGPRVAVEAGDRAATRWLERHGFATSDADVERVLAHIVRQRRGVLWGVAAAAIVAIVLWLLEPVFEALLFALPVAPITALVATLSAFRRRGRGADGGRHPKPSPPALLTWIRRLLPLAALGLGGLSLAAYLTATPPDLSADPLPDLGAAAIVVFTGLVFAATVAVAAVGEVAIRWAMSRRAPTTDGVSPEVDFAVASSALAIAEAQTLTLAAIFLAPLAGTLSFWIDSESEPAVAWTLAVATVAPALVIWALAHRGLTRDAALSVARGAPDRL